MYVFGAVLALLSISNAFLHDNNVNSTSLSIYSPAAIGASIVLPANLAKRVDPPLWPPDMWPMMCLGLQLSDAMQLAAYKAHTNSPQPPLGPLNAQSRFINWNAINRNWDSGTSGGCGDLNHLNTFFQSLSTDIPPVSDPSFHTWWLRVGQIKFPFNWNLDTHSKSIGMTASS